MTKRQSQLERAASMIAIIATYPDGGAAVAYHPQPRTAAEWKALDERVRRWAGWGYHVFIVNCINR